MSSSSSPPPTIEGGLPGLDANIPPGSSTEGPIPGFPDVSQLPQDDLGPQVRVIVWVLGSVSGVFLALRIYCKYLKHRGLHLDDWVLIASWLALMGDVIFTTIAIHYGHGKHNYTIPLENVNILAVTGLASVTFGIAGQAWSKTSFALTLLRIAQGRTRWFVWFAIASINILLGLGALFFWIPCRPLEKAWKPFTEGTCWDPMVSVVYGVIASSYSGIMDLALAALPWKIVLALQMKKKEKIGVAVAMSMGVAAGVAAFIKSSYIPDLASGDFSYDGSHLVIWGAAETAITIMAASIPVMRVLVRDATSTARYYNHTDDTAGSSSGPRRHHTAAAAATDGPGVPPKTRSYGNWARKGSDDGSERGFAFEDLGWEGGRVPEGKIVQTTEIAVRYGKGGG